MGLLQIIADRSALDIFNVYETDLFCKCTPALQTKHWLLKANVAVAGRTNAFRREYGWLRKITIANDLEVSETTITSIDTFWSTTFSWMLTLTRMLQLRLTSSKLPERVTVHGSKCHNPLSQTAFKKVDSTTKKNKKRKLKMLRKLYLL
ncbi:hypothetical protein PR048_010211 [Dryococelus australis]|uniref:Uncharacterized protein n=1 Tax=Dryococelus australis TaxID=614101 RepID=A0ABQ9I237_9NEOP|nr:hypothetical protein PR048_010211 [Dryococelus australis]